MSIPQLRCVFTQDFQDDFVFVAQGTVMDLPVPLARSLNQRRYVNISKNLTSPVTLQPGGTGGGGSPGVIDGGTPESIFGGTPPIDGGTP